MITRKGSGTFDNLHPGLAVGAGTDPADDTTVNGVQVDALGTRTHDATLWAGFTAAFTALFNGLFVGGVPTAANAYLRRILETIGALPAGIGIPTLYELVRDRLNPSASTTPPDVVVAPGAVWQDLTPWVPTGLFLAASVYCINLDATPGNDLTDARIILTPDPVAFPLGAGVGFTTGPIAAGAGSFVYPPGGLFSDQWAKVQASSVAGSTQVRCYFVGKRW